MKSLQEVVLEAYKMQRPTYPIDDFYNYFKNLGIFKENRGSLEYTVMQNNYIIITKDHEKLSVRLKHDEYYLSNNDAEKIKKVYKECKDLIEEDDKIRKELKTLRSKTVYCVKLSTQSPVDKITLVEMPAKDVIGFIEDYGYPVEVYKSKESAEKVKRAIEDVGEGFRGIAYGYSDKYAITVASRKLDNLRKTIKDAIISNAVV